MEAPRNARSITCESRRADATVAIDPVHTGSMHTRVAGTVIKINFTIKSCKRDPEK